MDFRKAFHYISYLQYPLMLIAAFFMFKPYLQGFEVMRENSDLIFQYFNSSLIFIGLAFSFSSLQDTSKTQNDFSKRIWQNPKKGKLMILAICGLILITLTYGIVLSLGMFGFLKAAIEMFENHRLDKIEASSTI